MADELTDIEQFANPMDAEEARVYLEAEGIQAFVVGSNSVALWGNSFSGATLQVPTPQAEVAKALLETRHEELRHHAATPAGSPDAIACLECGTPMAPGQTTCSVCGWSYGSPKDAEEDDAEEDD